LKNKRRFFESEAGNHIVSLAVKSGKLEKEILKQMDSEILVELYSGINQLSTDFSKLCESIEKKLTHKKNINEKEDAAHE